MEPQKTECRCEAGERCRVGDWRVSHGTRGEAHDVYTLDLGAAARLGVLHRSFRVLSDHSLRAAAQSSGTLTTLATRRAGLKDRVVAATKLIADLEALLAQARDHRRPRLEARLGRARAHLEASETKLARVPDDVTAVEIEFQRLRRERDALAVKLLRPSQGRHRQGYYEGADDSRGDNSRGWRRHEAKEQAKADAREGDAATAGVRAWLTRPGVDYLREIPGGVSVAWADAFATAHQECSAALERGATVEQIREALAP